MTRTKAAVIAIPENRLKELVDEIDWLQSSWHVILRHLNANGVCAIEENVPNICQLFESIEQLNKQRKEGKYTDAIRTSVNKRNHHPGREGHRAI